MPKIIENVREQLLLEAARQVATVGYTGTTIRSVAGACGLAVGTVYNYFPSKDMLIATFMAEDWKQSLKELDEMPTESIGHLLLAMHKLLCRFAERHQALFTDKAATKAFASVFSERHRQLRGQLSRRILPHCGGKSEKERQNTADFIAEGLLSFTMEGMPSTELIPLLLKLCNEK